MDSLTWVSEARRAEKQDEGRSGDGVLEKKAVIVPYHQLGSLRSAVSFPSVVRGGANAFCV